MNEIQVSQLAQEIINNLRLYDSDVKKMLEKKELKIAKETAKDVSSRASEIFEGSAYAGSWKQKKVGDARYIFSEKPYCRLAHLLEKSHATGNNTGHYIGRPHIKPAEEVAIAKFEAEIKSAIRSNRL